MPHNLTPRDPDVLAAHLAICLDRFSALASSPCCLVPIFKSRMHGFRYFEVIFSSIKKSIKEKHYIVAILQMNIWQIDLHCLLELSSCEMLLMTSAALPFLCTFILQWRNSWVYQRFGYLNVRLKHSNTTNNNNTNNNSTNNKPLRLNHGSSPDCLWFVLLINNLDAWLVVYGLWVDANLNTSSRFLFEALSLRWLGCSSRKLGE